MMKKTIIKKIYLEIYDEIKVLDEKIKLIFFNISI